MDSSSEIAVAFLSLSDESSAKRFFERIMKDENSPLKCSFLKLKPEDLESFHCERNYDAFVLLHSVSQGRNSVTDVADAKYDKLLLQLKQKYGPKRVAVVVHSISSYNSNTSFVLMMTFKDTQPTTFECSECVIQCNNLCDMPDDDLSRLISFLQDARDQPRPKEDDEPPSSSVVRRKTGGKTYSHPDYGSFLGEPSRGGFSPVQKQTGYQKITDDTNPVALVVLSGPDRTDGLLRDLRSFLTLETMDVVTLIARRHCFKAVLFDVGEMKAGIYPSEEAISFVKTYKKISGPCGHVALLMSFGNPTDADNIRRFCDHLKESMFFYTCDSSGNWSFDESTKNEMCLWLQDKFHVYEKSSHPVEPFSSLGQTISDVCSGLYSFLKRHLPSDESEAS